MALHLYNTLTGKKEKFEPYEEGHVRIYTCGPTVYDYIHLGNARAFVVPDVIKRYLQWRGYKVTHVQNITDIEDKIIAKAQQEGVDYTDIVDRYAQEYMDDLERLHCLPADFNPKASEHIDGIIDMVEKLIERGHAYAVGANVYFAVTSMPEYGALSGQSLDSLMAGARVDVDEGKRHPADFSLWKAAKPGEPSWDSPWGPGRPGWHIECSVMSSTYLGQPFDIHTGGADLIFPHHENEIAQSEGATGEKFVRYWVHNGYINVDGEKMAKSKGNFFTLQEILKQYPPQVVRLFLVSKHYRSPIEFNDEVMAATERGYRRLWDAVSFLRDIVPSEYVKDQSGTSFTEPEAQALAEAVGKAIDQFVTGMNDDFNTAVALASLYDLSRQTNAVGHRAGTNRSDEVLQALGYALYTLQTLSDVLGLDLTNAPQVNDNASELTDDLIALIVELRNAARKEKAYDRADFIRDRLSALGVQLEDGPEGTRWKVTEG